MEKLTGRLALIVVDYKLSIKGTSRPWLLRNIDTQQLSQVQGTFRPSDLVKKGFEFVIPIILSEKKNINDGDYFMHLYQGKLSVHKCHWAMPKVIRVRAGALIFDPKECIPVNVSPTNISKAIVNDILEGRLSNGEKVKVNLGFWAGVGDSLKENILIEKYEEAKLYSETDIVFLLEEFKKFTLNNMFKIGTDTPEQWLTKKMNSV